MKTFFLIALALFIASMIFRLWANRRLLAGDPTQYWDGSNWPGRHDLPPRFDWSWDRGKMGTFLISRTAVQNQDCPCFLLRHARKKAVAASISLHLDFPGSAALHGFNGHQGLVFNEPQSGRYTHSRDGYLRIR